VATSRSGSADVWAREILALVILIGAPSGVAWVTARAVRRRRAPHAPWQRRERSHDDMLNVYAVRETDPPESQWLGAAAWSSMDFEQRIEDVRADADRRITAANSGDHEALTREIV
jgi:hypothetical protein